MECLAVLELLNLSQLPALPVEIHALDRDLVRAIDIEWWKSQSLQDCLEAESAEGTARLSAFMEFARAPGAEALVVAQHVRRRTVHYYLRAAERVRSSLALGDDDLPLPGVLRHRVMQALRTGRILASELAQCPSIHALIRQRIRAGVL